jgi:hypothetical protein
MVLCASAVRAGGINLTWGDGCWADNPQTVQTFACDTNTGSFSMTASFSPSYNQAMDNFTARVDVQTDAAALPDWWQICTTGGCRGGALTATAIVNPPGGNCVYAWPAGQPDAFVSWGSALCCCPGTIAPNRGIALANFGGTPSAVLHPGTEYYAFRLTIDAQKTTGVGACGGCSVPATIVLNEIVLDAFTIDRLTTPLSNTCLRWQAAGTTPCSATPVRNMTWGAIKSFYR